MQVYSGPMQGNLLTVEQAALALGLSPKTIRGWIFRRNISYCKLGHGPRSAVRVPAQVIENLIEESMVPARAAD
jgi:excisionase family DNA binding protein